MNGFTKPKVVVALLLAVLGQWPTSARERFPSADLHCDYLYALAKHPARDLRSPEGRISLDKLLKGGRSVQVFAIFVKPGGCKNGFSAAEEQIKAFKVKVLGRSNGAVRQAFNYDNLVRNKRHGIVSAVLSVEGAHILGNDPERLVPLIEAGVRVLSLTWNNSNAFAAGVDEKDPACEGLTPLGGRLLRVMERGQVVADLSHANARTFWDIVTRIKGPVMASHSNARAIFDHPRNLDDEQLLAIAEKQGLVGLVFYSGYIKGRGRAQMEDLARHYRYLVQTIGEENIGLGSDFEGTGNLVRGLEDASKFQHFAQHLRRTGTSKEAVEALYLGNALAFFKAAQERYSDIPPLNWRPLQVEPCFPFAFDGHAFDRLRTTAVQVCVDDAGSVGSNAWFGFRALGGPLDALAVRLASKDAGPTEYEVLLAKPAEEATDSSPPVLASLGRCPSDGSRCLLKFPELALAEDEHEVLLAIRPSPGTGSRCLEVQDLVPIQSVLRQVEP